MKKMKHGMERSLEERIFKMTNENQQVEKELNSVRMSYNLLKDQNSDLIRTLNQNAVSGHLKSEENDLRRHSQSQKNLARVSSTLQSN